MRTPFGLTVATDHGSYRKVLGTNFASKPLPVLPGDGQYYDTHLHTMTGSPLTAPGGPGVGPRGAGPAGFAQPLPYHTLVALTNAQRDLNAMQKPNGGWAQLLSYDSDAYSTGEALFALHESRVAPPDAAFASLSRGFDQCLHLHNAFIGVPAGNPLPQFIQLEQQLMTATCTIFGIAPAS